MLFPVQSSWHCVLEREDPGWLTSAFYSLKAGEETKFPGRGRAGGGVQSRRLELGACSRVQFHIAPSGEADQ